MENFNKQFFENTDQTGRHVVVSFRTGKKYYVEPIGSNRFADWGSINPVTGDMMVKKGWGKNRGSIDASESLLTPENGFEKTYIVECGSPYSFIQNLDSKYPDK